MEQKNSNKKIWLIAALLFLLAAAAAIAVLIVRSANRKDAGDVYDQMTDSVNAVAEEQKGTDSQESEDAYAQADTAAAENVKRPVVAIPEKNIDWDGLRAQNADIYAWIYVPDTGVDYPVLQHASDNDYYLNHNIDGSTGYPGCIYSEDYNTRDFTDIHTVLYGHNLKDNTMFSTLHNFEDEDFFDQDHFIFIYTQDDVFVYQIFAAYEYPGIHLLDNFDYTNEYVYEDYLKAIFETQDRVANVREDVPVAVQDKIITLSTCTEDHDSGLRFLVAGVLINAGK